MEWKTLLQHLSLWLRQQPFSQSGELLLLQHWEAFWSTQSTTGQKAEAFSQHTDVRTGAPRACSWNVQQWLGLCEFQHPHDKYGLWFSISLGLPMNSKPGPTCSMWSLQKVVPVISSEKPSQPQQSLSTSEAQVLSSSWQQWPACICKLCGHAAACRVAEKDGPFGGTN